LWTAELWAPVGLRYHALHHLFPSLPYHNLGKAHRRLMRELPADSPYRQTESPHLWASLRLLWVQSGGATVAAQTEHADSTHGESMQNPEHDVAPAARRRSSSSSAASAPG
jgi:fatty acid desaturase